MLFLELQKLLCKPYIGLILQEESNVVHFENRAIFYLLDGSVHSSMINAPSNNHDAGLLVY